MSEATMVRALVTKGIEGGYSVSVHDGEAWVIRKSKSVAAVIKALDGLELARVSFWKDCGAHVGTALLIWGNAPDGSELIADHTDNPAMTALVEAAEAH